MGRPTKNWSKLLTRRSFAVSISVAVVSSKLRGQDVKAPVSREHSMDNEKRKAERHFNDQAIKEAVKRMTPELEAASEAAHKMKDSVSDEDDYQEFDRIVELGYLVEAVSGLCGPHLHLLTDIADAL